MRKILFALFLFLFLVASSSVGAECISVGKSVYPSCPSGYGTITSQVATSWTGSGNTYRSCNYNTSTKSYDCQGSQSNILNQCPSGTYPTGDTVNVDCNVDRPTESDGLQKCGNTATCKKCVPDGGCAGVKPGDKGDYPDKDWVSISNKDGVSADEAKKQCTGANETAETSGKANGSDNVCFVRCVEEGEPICLDGFNFTPYSDLGVSNYDEFKSKFNGSYDAPGVKSFIDTCFGGDSTGMDIELDIDSWGDKGICISCNGSPLTKCEEGYAPVFFEDLGVSDFDSFVAKNSAGGFVTADVLPLLESCGGDTSSADSANPQNLEDISFTYGTEYSNAICLKCDVGGGEGQCKEGSLVLELSPEQGSALQKLIKGVGAAKEETTADKTGGVK